MIPNQKKSQQLLRRDFCAIVASGVAFGAGALLRAGELKSTSVLLPEKKPGPEDGFLSHRLISSKSFANAETADQLVGLVSAVKWGFSGIELSSRQLESVGHADGTTLFSRLVQDELKSQESASIALTLDSVPYSQGQSSIELYCEKWAKVLEPYKHVPVSIVCDVRRLKSQSHVRAVATQLSKALDPLHTAAPTVSVTHAELHGADDLGLLRELSNSLSPHCLTVIDISSVKYRLDMALTDVVNLISSTEQPLHLSGLRYRISSGANPEGSLALESQRAVLGRVLKRIAPAVNAQGCSPFLSLELTGLGLDTGAVPDGIKRTVDDLDRWIRSA